MLKKIRNMPLKQKLLAIILMGVLIMTVMSYAVIQILSSSYNKMVYQAMAETLSYSAKDITDYMKKMETLTEMFLADEQIQESMKELKDKEEDGEIPYKALSDLNLYLGNYYYNYNDRILESISLYTPVSMLKTNLIAVDRIPDEIRQKILAESKKKDGAVCWVDEYMDEYGLFLARDVRRLEGLELDTLGTILLNIDMDQLVSSSTKFEGEYGESEYLILSGEDILFHTENLPAEKIDTNALKKIDQYDIWDIGTSYFITHGTIQEYDWDYYCFVSYEEVAKRIQGVRRTCLAIILFDLALVLCLTIPLIKRLIVHITGLKERMQQFAADNTKVPETEYDYTDREDEIGTLNRQFDEMSETIIELIQKNYVNELLKKEAQIKALENQINPHFLYNTLDSIKWRAKAIGEKDISDMVEALGVLLRTSLRKNEKYYTVGQELEIVSSYITIQKLRYEERLLFENEIGSQWSTYKIPKLVLQPLIENAIFYGLETNVDECRILLSVEEKKDRLHFYVKNTGSEMEEDLLGKLKREEIKPHGHGVGLINIDSRVKMQYGEEYGLRLYDEGEFAVAELIIPMEEMEHVEIDHRR